ncbi:unnamed protein product [Auanema sp. JU1783]|nr:unnamed protein product [Auanema sp. JU1783]
MQFAIFVLSLIFVLESVHADKMSWCDYWYRRGIARVECTRPRQAHWSIINKENKVDANTLSMPICDVVTDWGRCQKAAHCPLGLLCWVKGNPCCTPQTTNTFIRQTDLNQQTCPSPQMMGVQCNAKKIVNWCHSDSDCHSSGLNQNQRCCPSGCGYNMCLRMTPPIDMVSRLSAMSVVPSQCPRMDAVNIGCSRQFGTSWCRADSDCYSNSAQQRFCCPTRCGYNVCLLQLSENKWAIA